MRAADAGAAAVARVSTSFVASRVAASIRYKRWTREFRVEWGALSSFSKGAFPGRNALVCVKGMSEVEYAF